MFCNFLFFLFTIKPESKQNTLSVNTATAIIIKEIRQLKMVDKFSLSIIIEISFGATPDEREEKTLTAVINVPESMLERCLTPTMDKVIVLAPLIIIKKIINIIKEKIALYSKAKTSININTKAIEQRTPPTII